MQSRKTFVWSEGYFTQSVAGSVTVSLLPFREQLYNSSQANAPQIMARSASIIIEKKTYLFFHFLFSQIPY